MSSSVPHYPNVSSLLGKFLKGEPKVLGTVQIMIALVMILFGIILTVYADSITVYSGILFWGSISYISSGALSVAANNKLTRGLVKRALVMNIFSAIIAVVAIVLFSLDLVIELRNYHCYDNFQSGIYYRNSCKMFQYVYQTRSRGISGVLLLFSILEFVISIYVSAFACKAVCSYPSEKSLSPSVGQNVVGSFDAKDTSKQTEKSPEYVEVFP
ncbi:hypothetical protein AAFF_G00427280 [Aldrovandia affinis]|uniref:Membrane-spanning 4-domains subfamily A member 4A-like n=1 Tax=Aldrovandia affinis TaxID=143900 RepID=A0AAD7WIV9_9TELE|nr:hypothetical protein AAFF_G00427280 [Aldrovandia affinis]